jgi:hypothetical protein
VTAGGSRLLGLGGVARVRPPTQTTVAFAPFTGAGCTKSRALRSAHASPVRAWSGTMLTKIMRTLSGRRTFFLADGGERLYRYAGERIPLPNATAPRQFLPYWVTAIAAMCATNFRRVFKEKC